MGLLVSLFMFMLLVVLKSGNAAETFNELGVNEASYLNWVQYIGHYNHSIFQEAKNKFTPCKTIHVHKNPGQGDYTTIRKAINSIPDANDCRVVISVSPGVYREKIEIPATKAYISLVGVKFRKTIIQWNDSADKKGTNGMPMGTYASATFAINSPYFIAENITFKNKAPTPPSGALGKQAVALRISGDTAAFIGCKFIGGQDTLYDHKGRHYFKNCYIQGSVDFIFGDGLSLYENCHLHAKTNSYGALTAQKRESKLEETGFSFVNCKVTGSGTLYLGRAWGSFSRVVFAYTYMDKIIIPKGWNDWGDTDRDMTVFYGQFKCSGPGAEYGSRVTWARELTDEEAQPFLSLGFIDGHQWLTNV